MRKSKEGALDKRRGLQASRSLKAKRKEPGAEIGQNEYEEFLADFKNILLAGHMKAAMTWLDCFFRAKLGKKCKLDLVVYLDEKAGKVARIMNHTDKDLIFRLKKPER